MARFLNPALGALDRLFKIDSAQRTTNKIDIENGLTPVLDVHRFAQEGLSWAQGLFRYRARIINAGAGNGFDAIDPPTVFEDIGILQKGNHWDYWTWLLDIRLKIDNGSNFDHAAVGTGPTGTDPSGYPHYTQPSASGSVGVVFYSEGYTLACNSSGVGTQYPVYPTYERLPQLVYPTDYIWVMCDSTAGATFSYDLGLWIGPPGCGPPGYA